MTLICCSQKTKDARKLEPSCGQGKYYTSDKIASSFETHIQWNYFELLIPRRILTSTLLSKQQIFDCICFVTMAPWHGSEAEVTWELDHDQFGKEC